LGLSMPFYIIGAFALLGTVASRFILPETKAVRGHASSMNWRYLVSGHIGTIAIANLFFIAGCYGIYSIIGFHVQDRFVLAPQEAAQMMGLGLMSAAASNVVAQALVIRRFKLSPRVLLLAAAPMVLVAFAVLAVTENKGLYFASMALNGFGQGLAGPAFAAALSLSVGAGEQGRIAGVSSSLQAMAFLIGPFSAAALYQYHPPIVFIIGCVLVFASLPVFLTVARRAAAGHENLN
ncbi:MAG: MFS transporter, partial [Rhodobacteraceae bacterium]|nr:MFS transporter [Paracoccaceae bacterium]